jgi:hypothetical protein
MTKLKLGSLVDEKPVKMTVDLPAALFADLVAYGRILGEQGDGAATVEPVRLIVPMLSHFLATDRGFAKARRAHQEPAKAG